MPRFSRFTPFGLLQFSRGPSEAEKVYSSVKASYRDPATGATVIDTSSGTYHEAKVYGWSIAIGTARMALRQAGRELRGETAYYQLEAQEERYKVSPGADDSVPQRRLALAAKQKAARGPRFESVWEGLSAILGDDLVAYRPINTTEAVAYPSDPSTVGIFRRPDAVAKSIRTLDAITRPGRNFVVSSYSESNRNSTQTCDDVNKSSIGQSFLGSGGQLSRATAWAKKTGSPTGSVYAKIYLDSGSFGTDSVPTGEPLAVSAAVDVSALSTSFALVNFDFSGEDAIVLEAGTAYHVVFDGIDAALSVGNTFDIGIDNSSPTHVGNASAGVPSVVNGETIVTYSAQPFDVCFYVYALLVQEVAYENWNRSAVEENVVKGDVLILNPDNYGLVERVTVLEASGSGDERKFKAAFQSPHSANCYATTGPVPLWTNTKRHVLVVVKAAAAIDPAIVARVDELLRRLMRGPTTWALVQETTPGAGTVGPFKVGETLGSPLGAVPIQSITI